MEPPFPNDRRRASVISRIDRFQATVGGEPHSGWLPSNAAKPLPMPKKDVVLSFTIEFDGVGYLLIVDSADGSVGGDTWHQSVEDAQATAETWYGVPTSTWIAGEPPPE